MGEAISTHAPRFLMVRGGAIGDFIVTLPVLQALRTQWPLATIHIWGYPHIAQLAVCGGLAESVLSLDRADMSRFFVPSPDFTEEQIAAVRSYDIILNYLHDPVGQVRSNLLLAGARQVLSGSPIIKRGHAIPFLLEPLQALAIFETDGVPELDVSGEARAEARRALRDSGFNGRPFAVHPGSGSPLKQWPLEHFLEILRRIQKAGREVVVLLGEADRDEGHVLLNQMPDLPRFENLPLQSVAALLSECSGYLGNDSGITHLAAAVGIPVTALFGPSNVEIWKPRGRAPVQVLQASNQQMDQIRIDEVWAALHA